MKIHDLNVLSKFYVYTYSVCTRYTGLKKSTFFSLNARIYLANEEKANKLHTSTRKHTYLRENVRHAGIWYRAPHTLFSSILLLNFYFPFRSALNKEKNSPTKIARGLFRWKTRQAHTQLKKVWNNKSTTFWLFSSSFSLGERYFVDQLFSRSLARFERASMVTMPSKTLIIFFATLIRDTKKAGISSPIKTVILSKSQPKTYNFCARLACAR